MDSSRSVQLSSGQQMPLLGLGCWQASQEEVAAAVKAAILAGYRHIDSAYMFLNEQGVGDGIKAAIEGGTVKREELFVTTKLPVTGMKADRVEKCLRESLEALGLQWVDLYLVQMPCGFDGSLATMEVTVDSSTDLVAIWKEMERMVKLGLTKGVGVSNFNAQQVQKIVSSAEIPPAVNQVECHAYFQQRELREACAKHGIRITAYASLGSPGRKALFAALGMEVEIPDVLTNAVVRQVADKHQKTPAQVLLRFLVQQGVAVIPKSTNEQRIRENGDLFSFSLDDADMKALEALDKGGAGRSFDFTVVFPGIQDHPEYTF